MKRLLIGDCRESLLSSIEVILKHWGYRVMASSRPEQLREFIEETSPDLLIMGSELLAQGDEALVAGVVRRSGDSCPLILLGSEPVPGLAGITYEVLEIPLDIFALFERIQKHLEEFPRKNLRLAIKLPGLLCRGETCHVAEVLSLSQQGLFIKTGFRLEQGDTLQVVIPLMGMKKELEVEGQVLYRVQPAMENNYLQGVGIEFTTLTEEARQALQVFIQGRFLREVSNRPWHPRMPNEEHLRTPSPETTLRLIDPN
jgi:Tfp pilus assembly protein PilZ